MPSDQLIQSVYDFERIIPDAFAVVLADYGLVPCTISNFVQFQDKRPRTEILFRTGPEKAPRQILVSNNRQYNGAWTGEISFTFITGADQVDRQQHSLFLSKLRYLVPTLPFLVNGTPGMLNLKVQSMLRDAGTSTTAQNSDGYWQTTIQFTADISLQSTAIAAIAA